jgi:lantibiotic modifying enzyme
VDAKACRSDAEVAAFYTRLGMLIRLLQLLGGRDFWFDNLIAVGAMPALIDLETAIQQRPRTPVSRLSPSEERAYDVLEESAVNIGLVAQCTPIGEGAAAEDIGAMTPPRQFTTPFRFEYSPAIGELLGPVLSEDGFVQWQKFDYAPTLLGAAVAPAEYFDAVAAGYRSMHDHLSRHRCALAEDDGPLASLGGVPVRHIVRDTWSCMKIIDSSLRAPLLVDGIRREHFLDGLLRSGVVDGGVEDEALACLQSEIDAFRDLDIPLFRSRPGDSDLSLTNGGTVAGYFTGNAMERVWQRLREIDCVDVDEQIDLLRSNLATGAHPPPVPAVRRTSDVDDPGDGNLVERAVQLGDAILSHAFRGDGDLSWLGLTHHPAHGLRAVEVLRPDVLTGTGGLAILFADLYRVTCLARFADAAVAALGSTRRIMVDAPRLFARLRLEPRRSDSVACGRWYGIGSQILSLRHVGRRIGEPEIEKLAWQYLEVVDLEQLARRAPADVVGGLAGLLSVVLSDVETPGSVLERIAIDLVEAILDRLDADGMRVVHPYPNVPGPCGAFPDGVGGVRLLLARSRPLLDDGVRSRVDEWCDSLDGARAPASTPYQQLLADLSDDVEQPEAAARARAFIERDPTELTSCELLDVIEIALAGANPAAGPRRSKAVAAAWMLVERRRSTGSWYPETYAADRHNLSISNGVAAVAHAFLRCHDPIGITSVRAIG